MRNIFYMSCLKIVSMVFSELHFLQQLCSYFLFILGQNFFLGEKEVSSARVKFALPQAMHLISFVLFFSEINCSKTEKQSSHLNSKIVINSMINTFFIIWRAVGISKVSVMKLMFLKIFYVLELWHGQF